MSQERSKLFSLNTRDFVNGLIMAVLTVVLGGALTIISAEAGSYGTSDDWLKLLHAGVVAGLSYLIKNFFTGNGETK